jgi:hypothetical protein
MASVSIAGMLLGALSPLERQFYAVPSNASAREHLFHITSEAHVAGTPGDLKMARYVHDAFTSYGLESRIEAVPVLLNYLVERSLELLDGPGGMSLLAEEIIPSDRTSDTYWRNHTFNVRWRCVGLLFLFSSSSCPQLLLSSGPRAPRNHTFNVRPRCLGANFRLISASCPQLRLSPERFAPFSLLRATVRLAT